MPTYYMEMRGNILSMPCLLLQINSTPFFIHYVFLLGKWTFIEYINGFPWPLTSIWAWPRRHQGWEVWDFGLRLTLRLSNALLFGVIFVSRIYPSRDLHSKLFDLKLFEKNYLCVPGCKRHGAFFTKSQTSSMMILYNTYSSVCRFR